MAINQFFNDFMVTEYSFVINYITGIDILMMLLGSCITILFISFIVIIKESIKDKISKKHN